VVHISLQCFDAVDLKTGRASDQLKICPEKKASYITRPCCHRKPLHNAGHLYRKLAPNPQATQ